MYTFDVKMMRIDTLNSNGTLKFQMDFNLYLPENSTVNEIRAAIIDYLAAPEGAIVFKENPFNKYTFLTQQGETFLCVVN